MAIVVVVVVAGAVDVVVDGIEDADVVVESNNYLSYVNSWADPCTCNCSEMIP